MTEETNKYTITLLVTFNPGGHSLPEYKTYSEAATQLVMKNGGKPNKPYFIKSNAGNGETPNAVFTIEFPTKEDAEKTFMSDEYKALIPTREVAIKTKQILFPN